MSFVSPSLVAMTRPLSTKLSGKNGYPGLIHTLRIEHPVFMLIYF